MIGLQALVYIVVGLLIGGLIVALLWWLIGYVESQIPGVPMLFKIIRVVFVVVLVLILISILLGMLGVPVIRIDQPVR